MSRPAASQRSIRRQKLSIKLPLRIIQERELEEAENNDLPAANKIETGVEKHEESEIHLQKALQAAKEGGNAAAIPTPECAPSSIPYGKLYTLPFEQPATYIRSSSTVEDSIGCPYNLTDDDDVYLRQLNERRARAPGAGPPCTEDQFEEAMHFFEEAAKARQPFAALGEEPPPVLTWPEMQEAIALDDDLEEPVRAVAPEIYLHWQKGRVASGNTPLQPALRIKIIETATDVDDNDPYVCFRRREPRLTRKTRGRDAQSAEKLRRLRRELEEARSLVALVHQRELAKKEQLAMDSTLFDQRAKMRKLKRSLPLPYREGDEDLLVNQKPVKKKPSITVPTGPAGSGPASARLPTPGRGSDGRPLAAGATESDFVSLSGLLAEKKREIEREIAVKKQQHTKWNENFVDRTRAPLDPDLDEMERATRFRPATLEYLPTPPSSDSGSPCEPATPGRTLEHSAAAIVRFASPSHDDAGLAMKPQPSFRMRTGRLGRMWLDRRNMPFRPRTTVDPRVAERFKYDWEGDDDENEWSPFIVDPDDPASMRYRAAISGSHPAHTATAARRPQTDTASMAVGAQQLSAIQKA